MCLKLILCNSADGIGKEEYNSLLLVQVLYLMCNPSSLKKFQIVALKAPSPMEINYCNSVIVL